MQRRILISLLLSFLVLYVWSILNRKILNEDIFSMAGPTNNNHNKINNVIGSFYEGKYNRENRRNLAEAEKIVETESLIIIFSNLGGSIKNVNIKNYNINIPIDKITNMNIYDLVEFKLEYADEKKVIYKYRDDDFEVKNTYNLNFDKYIINKNVSLKNISNSDRNFNFEFNIFNINMSNLENNELLKNTVNNQDKNLYEYVIKSNNNFLRKNNAFKFSSKENKIEKSNVDWIGFRDRYYCAIIKPEFDVNQYNIKYIDSKNLSMAVQPEDVFFSKDNEKIFSFVIFVGPEEIDILKNYKLGFDKIKRFYRIGFFDLIAKAIYKLMHFVYKISNNWGISIITVSTIIFFSMYPLTLRGMASMKKMQTLQPQISIIKIKYNNNPQKMNEEMLKLYKNHSINPIGGCLPFILQMPIFIGLYQVLWRSVSFNGAKFLWIKDLSKPDQIFILPNSLPLIGNEINILPILMMIVMFIQQKISARNIVVTDPAYQSQQKIMTVIMPIFLGFIFYKFASGLTLYFTTFYIFSTFTQWYVMNKNKLISNG